MDRKYWRGRALDLGPDEEGVDPLGPDDRDADLLDDSWERAHSGWQRRGRRRMFQIIVTALSLLALAGILVPMTFVMTR